MNKIILNISGMSCSACSSGLEKYLNKQSGIKYASVNLVLAQVLIEYDDSINIEILNRYIKEAGFKSNGVYDEKVNNEKNDKKIKLTLFLVISVIIIYISSFNMLGLYMIPIFNKNIYPNIYVLSFLFLTVPFLIYGFDIFKNGLKKLVHKMPNMDTLVTIGVFSNFF